MKSKPNKRGTGTPRLDPEPSASRAGLRTDAQPSPAEFSFLHGKNMPDKHLSAACWRHAETFVMSRKPRLIAIAFKLRLTPFDRDDLLQQALILAYNSAWVSHKKGDGNRFENYFWMTLRQHCMRLKKANVERDWIVRELVNFGKNIPVVETDIKTEKLLGMMTGAQAAAWFKTLQGSEKITEASSRQNVKKLLDRGIERARRSMRGEVKKKRKPKKKPRNLVLFDYEKD